MGMSVRGTNATQNASNVRRETNTNPLGGFRPIESSELG